MDWNRVEGNWKQMKGAVKQQWGKLTDDDLTQINGSQEKLEGIIQERYGIARDETRKQIELVVSKPELAISTEDLRLPRFASGASFSGLSLEARSRNTKANRKSLRPPVARDFAAELIRNSDPRQHIAES